MLIGLQFFLLETFLGKFAVKRSLTIPQLVAYVATLPREALMSENKRLRVNYNVV